MSRYIARRWLLAALGFSFSLLTAGANAQEAQVATEVKKEVKKADAQSAEQKKTAEPSAAEAKLRSELNAKDEQFKALQKELHAKDEQFKTAQQKLQTKDEQLKAAQQVLKDMKQFKEQDRFVRRRLSPAEAAIYAQLDRPTVVEFIETPLADVVSYLEDYHSPIQIEIDTRALDDLGVGTDTPISRALRAITLRSALELLLQDLDLRWIVDNDVLLITTREVADAHLEIRTYDVSTLVDDGQQLAELVKVVKLPLQPAGGTAAGCPHCAASHAEHATAHTACCAAGSSDSIVGFGTFLVIRTNQGGHERVEELLDQLQLALDAKQKAAESVPAKPKPKVAASE